MALDASWHVKCLMLVALMACAAPSPSGPEVIVGVEVHDVECVVDP
jgi:hypothetical protein